MNLADTPLITLARMTPAERRRLIRTTEARLETIQARIDALKAEKAAHDSDPTHPTTWGEAFPEPSEELLDLPQLVEIESRALAVLKRIDFN